MRRLVYICDWLPPDFGAVGQYAMGSARKWAEEGWQVTLIGLASGSASHQPAERVGTGSVEVVRVHRPTYSRQRFLSRLIWTAISNVTLLVNALGAMREADAVLFTGSPPLMLHFIAPLNMLLRKRLIYRITDFYPECLVAERGRSGIALGALLKLTHFWRRRIDNFEVLGLDQAARLAEAGVEPSRIQLKRYSSPVAFPPSLQPMALPPPLRDMSGVILYSGNWGVAHDERTFVDAYVQYVRQSERPLGFWINATGAKADRVADELRARSIVFFRSGLVPLEDVPRLLIAADVHLVTLRDAFVGYVLPSKIHACIESGKRILFVGSAKSDVHVLADQELARGRYWRVDVGDVDGLVKVLLMLEGEVVAERHQVTGAVTL